MFAGVNRAVKKPFARLSVSRRFGAQSLQTNQAAEGLHFARVPVDGHVQLRLVLANRIRSITLARSRRRRRNNSGCWQLA